MKEITNKTNVVISGENWNGYRILENGHVFAVEVLVLGKNSILCTNCQKWVHKKCRGINGSMVKASTSFVCTGCTDQPARTNVDIGDGVNLELENMFCFLGDMLSVDGNADVVVEAGLQKG